MTVAYGLINVVVYHPSWCCTSRAILSMISVGVLALILAIIHSYTKVVKALFS